MLLKSPLLTKVSILHDREVPLHAVKNNNNNIMNNKTVAFSLSINGHITLIEQLVIKHSDSNVNLQVIILTNYNLSITVCIIIITNLKL